MNKRLIDLLDRLENEKKEYLQKNKVGFYITDQEARFIRTKRFEINYDWTLKYDEITGIAFANVMRFDDDSSFIIFLRKGNKPIYFNMTHDSEEMQNFELLMEKLSEKLGLKQLWKQDEIILAYPEKLRGKTLYEPWNKSVKTIIHEIGRIFGLKHHVSGIIKDELSKELLM